MARLDRWHADGEVLSITLSVTDYQTLFYSNSHVELIEKEWGAKFLSKALGISTVLVTGDKRIPVIKRSSHVGEYPGCLDVFGGHIDVERAGDVVAAMRDEL